MVWVIRNLFAELSGINSILVASFGFDVGLIGRGWSILRTFFAFKWTRQKSQVPYGLLVHCLVGSLEVLARHLVVLKIVLILSYRETKIFKSV